MYEIAKPWARGGRLGQQRSLPGGQRLDYRVDGSLRFASDSRKVGGRRWWLPSIVLCSRQWRFCLRCGCYGRLNAALPVASDRREVGCRRRRRPAVRRFLSLLLRLTAARRFHLDRTLEHGLVWPMGGERKRSEALLKDGVIGNRVNVHDWCSVAFVLERQSAQWVNTNV
jgi:hypothetical protein